MNELLGTLAEPWARRWSGQVAGAALAFWVTGLVIYVGRNDASELRCPATGAAPGVWCRIDHSGAAGYLILALAVLATVIGSASIMTALAPRLIYLLAGNGWPVRGLAAALSRPLVRWLMRVQLDRLGRVASAGTPVHESVPALAASPDRRRRAHRLLAADAATAQVDRAAVATLRRYPAAPQAMGLTRVANSLAAMNGRVWRRHGLDLSVCWEPLVAVLPESARESLTRESTRVTLQGQNLGWAIAALAWAALLPVPWSVAAWIVIVLIVLRVLYGGLCAAVDSYCDLIEATVAVHRHRLYRALGFAPPASTSTEPVIGALVTDYLLGSQASDLGLSWPAEDAPEADAPAGL
jgi:hypothetical protein